MQRPLCFVLMPFGKKPAGGGLNVDFDAVYNQLLKPAIIAADLDPIRADQEQAGGLICKPMFERLLLCEYAVADLTTANANVFYELGIRHSVKPWTTQLVFADGLGQLPFDVKDLRGFPYKVGSDGAPSNAAADSAAIAEKLRAARHSVTDSPVYQLVDGYPDVSRLKPDAFRDRVKAEDEIKTRLAVARTGKSAAALSEIAATLRPIKDAPMGVVIELFLSFRDIQAWDDMIALVDEMTPPLAASVMIREQLALALNRVKRRTEAEQVLKTLIEDRSDSSETLGILGRIYKDQWREAREAGQVRQAKGWLTKAIETYVRGFMHDSRDAYPGVNAVTLMSLAEPADPRFEQWLPAVRFAVERRLARSTPDYWDQATRLELAVLAREKASADQALSDALACSPTPMQARSTLDNLRLIRGARAAQGEDIGWLEDIERELAGPDVATQA